MSRCARAPNTPRATVRGAPTLTLSNGAIATYAGLSSAGQLQFTTTVPANGAVTNLAATVLNLHGGTITNDLGVVVTVPATLPAAGTTLSYNTLTDAIANIAEAALNAGPLTAGERVTFSVSAGKAIVSVSGKPTLTLNNGAVATYAGLSPTGQMEFATSVPLTGAFTNLAALVLNMNGAVALDSAGATVTVAASLPATTPTLSYNLLTDTIGTVSELASASGTLAAGDTITFLLAAARPVATVTGTPVLTLNNGSVATYAGLSGTGAMEFVFTVPAASEFADLAPSSLALTGVTVLDNAGTVVIAPATLPAPANMLSYDTITPPASTTTTTTTVPTTTTTSTTPVVAPTLGISVVDGVPVTVWSNQAIGPATSLGGGAARFTDGAGTGIADPSGNAETLAHLYQAILGRTPDAAGLAGWTGLVDRGAVSLATAAGDFVGSPEFASRFGALTDAQFVGVLAANTGAAATATDIAELAAGASRGAVAMQFAESAANVLGNIATIGDTNYGEIYRIYETTLGRAPDSVGMPAFLGMMQNGTSLATIVESFINSPEFAGKYGATSNAQFVSALYENGLGRAPDAGGLQTWTNDLASGASRANVVLAISYSGESRADTAAATHDNWVYLGK